MLGFPAATGVGPVRRRMGKWRWDLVVRWVSVEETRMQEQHKDIEAGTYTGGKAVFLA